jgi:oxygen-independent coproporphyrinogen-3 oxidase
VYWDGKGYHAFGMGASSYVHRSRVTRPRKFNAYLAWVKQFEESVENSHHPLPHVATPRATSEDVLTDMIMLQLRKASGLDLGMMERRFRHGALIKDAILDAISTSVERGLVEYDEDNNIVKFIDPDGFLLSNDVISDIFVALDRLKT